MSRPALRILAALLAAGALSAVAPARAQCTGACTVTTVGADTVVTFTGNGTFTPPAGVTSVRYLVVAGGGGGGGAVGTTLLGPPSYGGGGGGAGGVLAGSGFAVTPLTPYPVTVGAGGAGGNGGARGENGQNSSFGPLVALGGGGGGADSNGAGLAGGSGGGGHEGGSGGTGTGGQGNSGGAGGATRGGGGGGAGGSGGSGGAGNGAGGPGGAGVTNNITGANVTYAAGGVGGAYGQGRSSGTNGGANTGHGGGGADGGTALLAGALSGGNGGSGIVVIRYTALPANYFSRQNGNWSASATWSTAGCNGAAATSIPHSGATVTICNNHTVTLDQNAAIAGLILATGNNNVNLTHSGANSLTVGSGGVAINGGSGGNHTKAWNINAGSATVNGDVTLNGGSNNNRVAGINLTTGTLDINGNLIMNAAGNTRAVIAATGAADIFLSGDFTFNNGTLTPGPSSTFTYDGPGGFSLAHSGTIQYRHLVVNKPGGTSTQTGGTLTILGDFDLQAGAVNVGTAAISVGGATTIAGTLGITSATGAKTFSGAVTIASGGTWNNSGNAAVSIGGDLTNNGAFHSGTGTYSFSGNGTRWAGSSGLDFNGAATVSGSRTNDTTTTVNGNLTGGGALTNGANRILRLGGTSTVSGFDASAPGNTVEYIGGTAQTVRAATYHHLSVNKTGTNAATTAGSNTYVVNGNLTVVAGILNLAASTVTVAGTTNVHAGATLGIVTSSTGLKTFNGDVVVDGTWTHSSNAAVTMRGDLTVNGTWNMSATGTGAVYTFDGAGTQTIGGSSPGGISVVRLVLDNPGGLVLGRDLAITLPTQASALVLTNGRITTGSHTLHVMSTNTGAITGAGASRFIVGNLRRNYPTTGTPARDFPVGTGSNGYAPVTLTLAGPGGGGPSLTVSTSVPDHPQLAGSSLDPARSVNRWWTVTSNAGSFTSATAEFVFLPADLDGGADPAQFQIQRYSGGAWSDVTVGARTATSIEATGLTAFGEFAVGERVPGAGCPGGGQLVAGLLGSYYTFAGAVPPARPSGTPAGTRVDGPVDFNWGGGAPGVGGVGANQFSVRWDGYLYVGVSGNYQFQTESDDGVRLWVNDLNTPIIDRWNDHSATVDTSGNVALTAGQFYPIRLEFYENGGDAVIRLRWRVPGQAVFVPIPAGPTPTPGAGLYHCSEQQVPGLVAHYAMDEAAWNGTTGEVKDAAGSRHGTAVNGAGTAAATPAIPGSPGTCGYGTFDGGNDYVQVPGLSTILNGTASLAFWIRTTQSGNDTGWQAPGVTGVEQSGGADDIFWGWLDASGRIGISVGNDYATKSTIPINNGTWRHVVLTRDHVAGTYKIYIDGTLNASGSIATGLIGTPFSSIGRIEDTDGSTPEYFAGELDEVRVYDRVLTDADVALVRNLTRPCDAETIDHIRIEHDGLGLTCAPETITVKACTDAACTTTYNGNVQVTLASPPGGWSTNPVTLTTGSTTVELRHTTAGPVALGVGAVSPLPASPARCFNGALETCTMDFRSTGFLFDVPDLTACRPSAAVTITAVRTDEQTQTCAPAFSGTKTVQFWSDYIQPATGTQAVYVNGAPVGGAPGAPINLNFNASAQATFTVVYPDAGRVQLNARHTGSGADAGLQMDGNDLFVSVPVGLALYGATSCPAGDASCPALAKVGAPFPLTLKAACWTGDGDTDLSDNPATPNFQMTAIPISHTVVAPGGGASGSLGVTSVDMNPADAGVKTFDQTVTEVGVFRFSATPAAGGYFGLTVPGATSPDIGRFYPDRFVVSGATITPACSSSGTPFTYLGQSFGVSFLLQASTADGVATQNYEGAFAKLGSTDALGWAAMAGSSNLTARLSAPSAPVTFTSGVAAISTSLAVQRAAPDNPDGPFDARIGIAPVDSDGVSLAAGALDMDVDGVGGADHQQLGSDTSLRFGRLRLGNASGSERLPLLLPYDVQYWTGTAFATHVADGCTALAPGDFSLSNYQGALAPGETTLSVLPLVSGAGRVLLTAPGAGNSGSVDISIDLAGRPYLRGRWNDTDDDGNPATAYDDAPRARASFGIRGSGGEVIDIRERY